MKLVNLLQRYVKDKDRSYDRVSLQFAFTPDAYKSLAFYTGWDTIGVSDCYSAKAHLNNMLGKSGKEFFLTWPPMSIRNDELQDARVVGEYMHQDLTVVECVLPLSTFKRYLSLKHPDIYYRKDFSGLTDNEYIRLINIMGGDWDASEEPA